MLLYTCPETLSLSVRNQCAISWQDARVNDYFVQPLTLLSISLCMLNASVMFEWSFCVGYLLVSLQWIGWNDYQIISAVSFDEWLMLLTTLGARILLIYLVLTWHLLCPLIDLVPAQEIVTLRPFGTFLEFVDSIEWKVVPIFSIVKKTSVTPLQNCCWYSLAK